ncbi:MerR family transcriptional regulator (plasmid) [Peribacillus sp. JNUCC 23]
MSDVKWSSIGPVAERFGIEVPRLRTWCDKGLIEFDKRTTGRWIPHTEFPKIEKIIEVFNRGGNVTFDDVKEELIKENLYHQLQTDKEKTEKENEMALLLGQAFEQSGANEMFMQIGNEFQRMQQEVNRLSQLVEKQNETRLLEDNRMNKLQEDNEVLKGLVKDLISSDKDLKDTFNVYMKEQKKEEINKQAELEDKLKLIEAQLTSKKKEKKGLLSKIFR